MNDTALAHLCTLEWNGYYPTKKTCGVCKEPQVSFILAQCSWCKHGYLSSMSEKKTKTWSKICPKCDEISSHNDSSALKGYGYCQHCKEVAVFAPNKRKKMNHVRDVSIEGYKRNHNTC